MTTSTVPAYVQPRGKPRQRRFAGYGTHGSPPETADYERWGVNPANIYNTMIKASSGGIWTMILIETVP